jgi:rhodanese-related sulfurtransferase
MKVSRPQIPGDELMTTQVKPTTESTHQVPETNKTSLGLYVTPQEAYAMWKADPEQVNILDVRTFEEYIFVGHLEMARNIPFVFPKYRPPDEDEATSSSSPGGRPPGCYGELNPEFVSTVKEHYATTDKILVYCATGARGAMVVNQLVEAGFQNVYNIINGLEGDRVDDPGSVYHGKHMRNGWKNAGLPWGYAFHPDLM